MCQAKPLTPDVLEKLEDTVRRFVSDGRAFTAYNVTLGCREHEGIKLRHQSVQDAGTPTHEFPALREAQDFGDYQQTQINHPKGDGTWAWLYHPASYDPTNFQWEQTKNPAPAVVRSPAAQTNVDTQAADDDAAAAKKPGGVQSDGTHATDYRKRLFVPTQFLRDAGMAKYNTCHICICDGEIYLASTEEDFPTGSTVKSQVVEKDGDIRLSSMTLRGANFDDENGKYTIEIAELGDGPTPVTSIKITCSSTASISSVDSDSDDDADGELEEGDDEFADD